MIIYHLRIELFTSNHNTLYFKLRSLSHTNTKQFILFYRISHMDRTLPNFFSNFVNSQTMLQTKQHQPTKINRIMKLSPIGFVQYQRPHQATPMFGNFIINQVLIFHFNVHTLYPPQEQYINNHTLIPLFFSERG